MGHEGFSADDMRNYTRHPSLPDTLLTDAEFSHALDDLEDGNLVARSVLIADRFNLLAEVHALRARIMPPSTEPKEG